MGHVVRNHPEAVCLSLHLPHQAAIAPPVAPVGGGALFCKLELGTIQVLVTAVHKLKKKANKSPYKLFGKGFSLAAYFY